MWTTLAAQALKDNNLAIAERFVKLCIEKIYHNCAFRSYAALGDVSKAQFIHKALDAARMAEDTLAQNGSCPLLLNEALLLMRPIGGDHYEVRARLAMLNREYKVAETIFLEQVGERDLSHSLLSDIAFRGIVKKLFKCTNHSIAGMTRLMWRK